MHENSEVTKNYILNKALAEAAIFDRYAQGQNARVIRLPIMLGAGDHTERLDFYRKRILDGQGIIVSDASLVNKFKIAWVDDVARALADLVALDIKSLQAILDASPKESINLIDFLKLISEADGAQLRLAHFGHEIIKSKFPEYLTIAPFLQERELTESGSNLFKLVSREEVEISIWLKDLLRSSVRPSIDAIKDRDKENKFIVDFAKGYERFWPVIGFLEKVGRNLLHWRTDDQARSLISSDNMKTKADFWTSSLIEGYLQKLFQDHKVISEENYEAFSCRPDMYWLIDPIDGTASWLNGYSGFVTQAALIEDGIVKFGVIHAPDLKKTWIGLDGFPAFLNGEEILRRSDDGRLVLVDNYPSPMGVAKLISEKLPITGYIESGSIGLKGAMVVDGTADAFVKSVVVRDWDVAPLVPMLKAVGGFMVRAPDGGQYTIGGNFDKPEGIIIVRNASLIEKVVSVIYGGVC